MVVKYDKDSEGWENDATYEILYGDITQDPRYNPEFMGLRSVGYARNSKGESVLVKETGWALLMKNLHTCYCSSLQVTVEHM